MKKADKKDNWLIKIARVRAGVTQDELARLLYYSTQTIRNWEAGRVKAHWDELYKVFPELKVIRENGCDSVCDHPRACLGGICPFLSRKAIWEERAARGVEYHAKNCC